MISREDADDALALRRCQQGDVSGLEVLVARYQLRAIRIAYLLLRDHAAAEDIAQDSFLRVVQASAQFQEGAQFAPWFYRIVLNTARQHQRTLRRRRESSLDILMLSDVTSPQLPLAEDPFVSAEQTERRAAVLNVLTVLTTRQREALVLRYFCGLSDSVIAQILNCPHGTVRWRLHAAHRAFERAASTRYPWLLDRESPLSQVLARVEGGTN